MKWCGAGVGARTTALEKSGRAERFNVGRIPRCPGVAPCPSRDLQPLYSFDIRPLLGMLNQFMIGRSSCNRSAQPVMNRLIAIYP
jgi:hypothetical protein